VVETVLFRLLFFSFLRRTEISKLAPIVVVMPFAAQALVRWQGI